MTTDKELADAYELVIDDYYGHDATANAEKGSVISAMSEVVRELRTPKPTWPDGTIAWVTYTPATALDDGHPYQALAQYDADENEWVMERTHTGAACTATGDSVTKVEPLRVLGDNEIAIPRVPFTNTPKAARHYASALQREGFGAAALAFNRIADARDAEAGDAK